MTRLEEIASTSTDRDTDLRVYVTLEVEPDGDTRHVSVEVPALDIWTRAMIHEPGREREILSAIDGALADAGFRPDWVLEHRDTFLDDLVNADEGDQA